MKICLVGHFFDSIDEGVRIVAKNLFKNLNSQITIVKTFDINSIKSFKKINSFKPDIIHFILTPSLMGLFVVKFISILNPNSKIIISAIHPSIPNWRILTFLKPDLVLVQSLESKNLFQSLGFKTEYLCNGIDTDKFKPTDINTKINLRRKYNLPVNKFLILHLASLKHQRNLTVFKKLQKKKDNQVIIIGRENEDIDDDLVIDLEENGCKVLIEHFPKIEEIYNLSDCYVFPTVDKKACIETPLSVLEAMSCNLPVITTRFGSLPYLFENSKEGIYFVNNDEDFENAIKSIKNGLKIDTRELILPFSWEKIAKRLVFIYEKQLY